MPRYLTKVARQKLARKAATQAHGTRPTNHQIGQAGKVIDELVDRNPKQFIDFSNVKYCTPRNEVIIDAATKALAEQLTLF